MTRRLASPFFAGVRAGMAPLLVWALHFAACYVAVAATCALTPPSPDLPLLRTCLFVATAVAIATLGAMLWRGRAARGPRRFELLIRCVCAALALLGVAWSAVPMAMLATCTA